MIFNSLVRTMWKNAQTSTYRTLLLHTTKCKYNKLVNDSLVVAQFSSAGRSLLKKHKSSYRTQLTPTPKSSLNVDSTPPTLPTGSKAPFALSFENHPDAFQHPLHIQNDPQRVNDGFPIEHFNVLEALRPDVVEYYDEKEKIDTSEYDDIEETEQDQEFNAKEIDDGEEEEASPYEISDFNPSTLNNHRTGSSVQPGWMTDEEYDEYKSKPLQSMPTSEEIKSQVEELLLLDWKGTRMFPDYMHQQLRTRAVAYMTNLVNKLTPGDITQHDLHTELFTFFLQHGSKLAKTDDERVTILCPLAPAIGEKRTHHEFPDEITVIKRYFTTSKKVILNPDTAFVDNQNVGMEDMTADDMEAMNEAIQDGTLLDLERKADQRETLIKLKQLKTKEEKETCLLELNKRDRKRVEQFEELKEQKKSFDEMNSWGKSPDGGYYQLAVVYQFNSNGRQFESRYPLTKSDVLKYKLYHEE